ncbi:MAG: guanylate kinase [Candidatus Omnitrophica bacterium]|nr:guanylate kinase [Candidatus Omnitrophota bacterium]
MGGHAFVISGPSGGGKTTVVARLRRQLRDLRRSVSVTTRAPRAGERDGQDYRFISSARFDALRRHGQLLEWATVHGASYGTPKRPVLDALDHGWDVLLSIDVQGARAIKRLLDRRAILIFLMPPSLEQLRRRLLRRRTDTPAAIRRRMAAARREIACARWYDYTVVNDRLDHTVRQVSAMITACRRAHQGRPSAAAGQRGPRKGL